MTKIKVIIFRESFYYRYDIKKKHKKKYIL